MAHIEQVHASHSTVSLGRITGFEWVVRFFPDTDANTFTSLAAVYNALGDKKTALSILRKGSRLFPDNGELRKVETLKPPQVCRVPSCCG